MNSGMSVSARPAKLGTLTRISCPPLISLNTRAAFSCTEKPSDALHENQNSQPTRNWPGGFSPNSRWIEHQHGRNHSLVRQPRIWSLAAMFAILRRLSLDDLHDCVLGEPKVATDQAVRQAFAVHGKHAHGLLVRGALTYFSSERHAARPRSRQA